MTAMLFGRWATSAAAALIAAAFLASPTLADTNPPQSATNPGGLQGPWEGKDFDQLDQAEIDAAKQAAKSTHFPTLRVCADPGNMPLSDRAGEGFQNKIIEALAKAMGASVSYFWRSYTGNIVGEAFGQADECDLLLDMPTNYQDTLSTVPIYRTTYVFVSRSDEKLSIKGLDDPRLRQLRLGVFQISALREALQNHGVFANVKVWPVSTDTEWVPAHQPWRQVQEVVDGKLDIVGAWGPMAGWLKTMKGAPLTLQPANLMDDQTPMEFSLGIAVPRSAVLLKFALDDALKAHRAEIEKILTQYGVPLVRCADCIVPGDLPTNGGYTAPISVAEYESKPTHWTVSRAEVDQWLASGSSVNQELDDAVVSNDVDRAGYLISKGADVNKLDNLGTPPLETAARAGCIEMMQLLIEKGAKVDGLDSDKQTALMGAAMRNQAAAIKLLLARGASVEKGAPAGYTPLAIAVEEGQYDAAYALIQAGAHVNLAASEHRLTPLMVIASELPPQSRDVQVLQDHGPIDVARALLARKAKVDAADADGVTALMIAAARDNSQMIGLLIQSGANPGLKSATGQTARDIAVENDNLGAIRILDLLVRR
ncbi:MAG TPA: quinoprotein dehydrogenase-associated putative ABC transporter substrate-binding protein [Steroidobacteraceae bacterium]|jgi:quinoprotein dehydrogenase-associated probable ABC transporter substrate-binding protein|nr:quinoprotein dehydrogenase-associated putative ABC transporter substrate-binding protein [Steroidobacteraceae bacterium]